MNSTATKLAIDGGEPVRKTMLPYARQWLEEDDLAAVLEVLRSDWLTTGPAVAEFEKAFAAAVESPEAVAVSSGTAALHAAMAAAGIKTGDEVIVPAMTFLATANAVVFQGGTPVFADVDPDSLLIEPGEVARLVTPRTRAVVAVDYAGHPCDYTALQEVAARRGLILIDDACHALGAAYRGRKLGSCADLTVFSFHPAKHLTTGEGGMAVTGDPERAARMRRFRNHGISTDLQERARKGTWQYDMVELGYNYRLTDFQCALGRSQLKKQDRWLDRRREIARAYDAAFAHLPGVEPLVVQPHVFHAYHLYVIRLDLPRLKADRNQIFAALRAEGIGVNVHYQPVPEHPFYRQGFGTRPESCPRAHEVGRKILSLPMFPRLTPAEVEDVIQGVRKVVGAFLK
jgi:perosamine synthetase